MNAPKLRGSLGKTHTLEKPVPLREVLADVNSYVALTAKSAFYYIGKASDFLSEDFVYCDQYYTRVKVRMYQQALANHLAGRRAFKPVLEEHKPFLDRMVTEYYSRHLPDEHPMWIIQTEGKENGLLWLESETAPFLENVRKLINGG